MFARTRLCTALLLGTATMALGACGVPPLHRSVAVQVDGSGVPAHAGGRITHDRYTVTRGDTLYSIAFRADLDYHALARWNDIQPPYTIHPGEVLRLTRPAGMPASATQAPVFQTVSPPPAAEPVPVAPLPSAAVAAVAPTPAASASPASPTGAATQSNRQSSAAVAAPPVAVAPPVEAPATPPVTPAAPVPTGATRSVAGVTWRWPAAGKVISQFNPGDAQPGINIAGNAGDPVRAAAAGVVLYSGDGLVGYGELIVIEHGNDYWSAYGHNSKRLVHEGEHVKAGQVIALMGSTGAPRNELEFQVRHNGKPVNPLDYLPRR